jgi:hypothetical protein
MQQQNPDLEYVIRQSDPKTRFNWLYILPLSGGVWLFYLMGAAIFGWPVTGILNPVMGLFMVYFVVMVGLLIWARAPKENR